jgi:hypothetical protein
MPSLLRIAVMLTDHPDTAWLAKPPVALQRALFAVLAPIGRALGHSREHAALAARSRVADRPLQTAAGSER